MEKIRFKTSTIIRWAIMIIAALILMLITHFSSQSSVTGMVTYSDLKDVTPSFTNIEATVYFTPSSEDHPEWCSPLTNECFETTRQIIDHYGDRYNVRECIEERRAGWCCIPEAHRGMYEEIKCQGSGIYNGLVYRYDTLASTPEDSTAYPEYERGRTAWPRPHGREPTVRHTVAINPDASTDCYIEYGTKMYIYFGDNNPWNGVYVAEDTGSAFKGQCKIDIYAGVGEAAKARAINEITKYPKIYLLDEQGNPMPADTTAPGRYSSVTGSTDAFYSYEYKTTGLIALHMTVTDFASSLLNACSSSTYTEKDSCIDGFVSRAENYGLEVELSCKEEDFPDSSIQEVLDGKFEDGTIILVSGIVSEILGEDYAPEGMPGESRYIYITDLFEDKSILVKLSESAKSLVENGNSEENSRIEEGVFLEVNAVVRNSSSPKILEVFSEENINAGLTYYKKELLKPFALSLADCASSPQESCYCDIPVPDGYNAITFMGSRILLQGADENDYLELSIPVYPQNLSNTNNITKGVLTEFSYLADSQGMLSFKKDEENNLIAIINNVGQDLDACVPDDKHYLLCANKPGGQAVFRFALKI